MSALILLSLKLYPGSDLVMFQPHLLTQLPDSSSILLWGYFLELDIFFLGQISSDSWWNIKHIFHRISQKTLQMFKWQYYKENLMTFDLLPDWHRTTFFLTFLDTSSIFFISASWKNTLDFPNWNKTMKISCQSYRSNLIHSLIMTPFDYLRLDSIEWAC